MRIVTVKTPEGHGSQVADIAFAVGVAEVSTHHVQIHRPARPPAIHDVVELEAATPIVKAFIDRLMIAPFFDSTTYTFSIRHPRSVVKHEHPAKETRPIVVPTVDVFEELWQFSQVTLSFIGRVFVAGLLLAYGMIEANLLVMIAGLLFLPYHHQLLSIGLGVWTREWQLLKQGAWALGVSTLLITAAGACVALLTEPPLRFQEFGTLLSGFLIALIIGIAAALASADDAGRRELIGLAATAHITILPAWFGVALVFGFPEPTTVIERFIAFGINVSTVSGAAIGVYALLGMDGDGVRRFVQHVSRAQEER